MTQSRCRGCFVGFETKDGLGAGKVSYGLKAAGPEVLAQANGTQESWDQVTLGQAHPVPAQEVPAQDFTPGEAPADKTSAGGISAAEPLSSLAQDRDASSGGGMDSDGGALLPSTDSVLAKVEALRRAFQGLEGAQSASDVQAPENSSASAGSAPDGQEAKAQMSQVQAQMAQMHTLLSQIKVRLMDTLKASKEDTSWEHSQTPVVGTGAGSIGQGLTLKSRTPTRGVNRWGRGRSTQCVEGREPSSLHRKALEDYVFYGREEGLRGLALKEQGLGFDPDQRSVLMPQSYFSQLVDVLDTNCPLRQVASVQQISGRKYDLLVEKAGPSDAMTGAVWCPQNPDELFKNEAFTHPLGTSLPDFKRVSLSMCTLLAQPVVADDLEDLRGQDVGQWLHSLYSSEFVRGQNEAFCFGSADKNQPQGFVPAKASDVYKADDVGGSLIAMMHNLPAHFRAGGVWMMSGAALAVVRSVRNKHGDYLLSAQRDGGEELLLGYPVLQYDNLTTTDGSWIAFGDFAQGYQIIEGKGLEIQRNPFSSWPHVRFMVRYWVGGGVIRPQAIRTLCMNDLKQQ